MPDFRMPNLRGLRLTPGVATAAAFGVAAFVALLFAWASVLLIERITVRAVNSRL